tara:strand:+ start:223 stop:1107 length:885 start_codon:yes stop_codon:yes gene_type:complete
MKKYNCLSCGFHSNLKGDYLRHLQTKKHKKSPQSHHLVTPKSPFSHHLVTPKSPFLHEKTSQQFTCKYCNKAFKYKQGMYRHIKYTCKKNKDEDFQELARLLNEKEKQMTVKETKMNTMENELIKMQKQIDKLTNKLQIHNLNQGVINNTNNVVNIQLLNHPDTDYSHLTHTDYITCIHDCNHCIKSLIEKVHFNKNKPENMNIYLSNIKGKYVMIYKDNTWQISDKKRQIDDLYDNNEMLLENWYDEYKEKYPNIILSFKRYLKNRDEDVVLNRIKDEILLMLYNKRKMIESD